jgi:hypothetical protein
MSNNTIDYIELPSHSNAFFFINLRCVSEGYGCLGVTESYDVIQHSNDWLYLIGDGNYRDTGPILNHIKQNNQHVEFIDEDIIPFITAFPASIHGYAGALSILTDYINHLSVYEGKTVALYQGAQKGIHDIIKYFQQIDVIKAKIIFLEHDVIYKFRSITIIPNTLHSYFESITIRDSISKILQQYIFDYTLPNEYNISDDVRNIAILKHHGSSISSSMGAISIDTARNFCNKHNLKLIEPAELNEIQLIKMISNCEKLICSWGTTFMKNFIYISDKCKEVIVFIVGSEFTGEYNHLVNNEKIINQFKNAKFTYQIVNTELTDATI